MSSYFSHERHRRESQIGTLKVIDWNTICHAFLLIKNHCFPPNKWQFIVPKLAVQFYESVSEFMEELSLIWALLF